MTDEIELDGGIIDDAWTSRGLISALDCPKPSFRIFKSALWF